MFYAISASARKNTGRTLIFEGEQQRVGRESRVHGNKAVLISFLQRFRQDCAAERCLCSRCKSIEIQSAAFFLRLKSLRLWGMLSSFSLLGESDKENC